MDHRESFDSSGLQHRHDFLVIGGRKDNGKGGRKTNMNNLDRPRLFLEPSENTE